MTIHPRVLVQLVDKDTKDSAQSLRAAEISENEYRSGNTSPERVQEALEIFHRDGIVLLSNAIAHAPLDGLREHMIQDLSEVLEWTGVQYNQGRANKNISQCPPLSGEFVSEEIWANPHAVAVIERLVGLVPQLVHVGGNTALPNGRDRQAVQSDIQPPHPDFTFGVEVNIFLDSMSAANGVTEFWLGSHSNSKLADQDLNAISRGLIRRQKVEERRLVAPPIQPEIAKGSIVLRDLRLWHSGMPNYSHTPRMTLSFVFFPSWYRPPMRLTLPTSIRPVLESWKSIDAVTTSNFIDGPADHLRIPFGLNLN